MKKVLVAVLTVAIINLLVAGCSSMREVKNELTGGSKPEGGISEAVPKTKEYPVSHRKLWDAALDVLDEQGYLYEADKSSNMIKTELKQLGNSDKFQMIGSIYWAKLYITIEGSSITYKARFNKKSNITMAEENKEYPKKENAMRKEFYAALDERLGVKSSSVKKDTSSNKAKAQSGSKVNNQANVPKTKTYPVSHKKLWKAARRVLDDEGYLYEANKSSGMIKTELRQLGNSGGFRMIGSIYYAKLYVSVEGSSITFKARFNKKSNIMMAEENREYPEKEQVLRAQFFADLDKRLGVQSSTVSNSDPDAISIKQRYTVINIRSSDTTKSAVMGKLRKNQMVKRIDERGDWVQVELPDGRVGWIYKYLMTGYPDK